MSSIRCRRASRIDKELSDEFDPLFENPRKGWHKRERRENCLKLFAEYGNLDLELFTGLIQSFTGFGESVWGQEEIDGEGESSFARRLITGLAAEQYFETNVHNLVEFRDFSVRNTTRAGCGYDFQLRHGSHDEFLAVEVKGLKGRAGALSLTPKEYGAALALKDRFYLFVVKNFQESPFHEMFRNPLSGDLRFRETKRTIVQVSWLVNV